MTYYDQPKRTASPAQMRANKANARRSTGPVTKAGKEAARRNAVRHGMSGAGICLTPEDEARRQDRLVAWADSLNPEGEYQLDMLNLAVTNFVRLEGGYRQESAAIAEQARHAEDDWIDRRTAEVAELGKRVQEGDVDAVRRLRRTSAGCHWLLGAWDGLADALEYEGFWNETLTKRAQVLLSFAPGDPVTGFQADLLNKMCQSIQPPNKAPDRVEILTILAEQITDQRRTLAAERDRLELEIDGPSRLEARDRALADLSPTGALRLRYLNANDQAMHRGLRALQTAQLNALTMPPPQREDDTFVSTSAEGTWLHVPRGWDGPQLARVLDRAHAADDRRKRGQDAAPVLDQTDLPNEANDASHELPVSSDETAQIPDDVAPSADPGESPADPAVPEPASQNQDHQQSSNPSESVLPNEANDATPDSHSVYSPRPTPPDDWASDWDPGESPTDPRTAQGRQTNPG